MAIENVQIPVRIEKVLELSGAYVPAFGNKRAGIRAETGVNAHISTPIETNAGPVQYALLARAPQHGIALLGTINPETRDFTRFDQSGRKFARYERADNGVICEIHVPADQIEKLPTLDELLAIEGLNIRRELIPTAK